LPAQQFNRPPDTIFVQQTVDLATAEQLPGFALRLFGNFHSGFGRKFKSEI
jgi:hypothetical protein